MKSIIYAGLDVAKPSFVLHLAGKIITLPNTKVGHRKLVLALSKHQNLQVICEASGGYERGIFDALCAANIPASVLNPRQIHHFAKSLGSRAKTDPLDAQLLSLYGQRMRPEPTAPRTQQERQLAELVRHRRSLLGALRAQQQSLEQVQYAPLRRELKTLLKQMEARLAKIETLIGERQKSDPELERKSQRLTQITGVGKLTAISLLAEMPELGTLRSKQAAALAGLAPYARESGAWKGCRSICGGRAEVRRILYMAALSAKRYHSTLSGFYQNLRAKGKPFKVAISAVMRKLLLLLNLALKFPNLVLVN